MFDLFCFYFSDVAEHVKKIVQELNPNDIMDSLQRIIENERLIFMEPNDDCIRDQCLLLEYPTVYVTLVYCFFFFDFDFDFVLFLKR